MRALIVDDSSFIRNYEEKMLHDLGIQSIHAADGCAALAQLSANDDFDFVLLDINMPRMNGLECARAIRSDTRYKDILLMMVTTEADMSFVNSALKIGADEFLMKPFTEEGLREKLILLGVVPAYPN